jgi:hypothetical protein
MFIRNILFAAALTFAAPTAVLSQDKLDLGSSKVRIELEASSDKMLVEMLAKARDSILREKRPIVKFPFVCPHAMFALAAITSGAVGPEAGAKFFVAGLMKDREEMVSMHITGQPGFDLMAADISLNVKMSDKVTRENLAKIVDMGIGFLGR